MDYKNLPDGTWIQTLRGETATNGEDMLVRAEPGAYGKVDGRDIYTGRTPGDEPTIIYNVTFPGVNEDGQYDGVWVALEPHELSDPEQYVILDVIEDVGGLTELFSDEELEGPIDAQLVDWALNMANIKEQSWRFNEAPQEAEIVLRIPAEKIPHHLAELAELLKEGLPLDRFEIVTRLYAPKED